MFFVGPAVPCPMQEGAESDSLSTLVWKSVISLPDACY